MILSFDDESYLKKERLNKNNKTNGTKAEEYTLHIVHYDLNDKTENDFSTEAIV